MDLNRIQIKNFKSIDEATVTFNQNLKILVGKNESGKTNLLKAFSLLDPQIKIESDDLREPLPDEESYTEAHIWFIFKLNDAELHDITTKVKSSFFINDFDIPLIKSKDSELTLSQFVNNINEGLYVVNLITKKRYYACWADKASYKFISPIYKPKNYKETEGSKTIENYRFINKLDISKEDQNTEFINTGVEELHNLVIDKIKELLEEKHPKVIFWKYEEENLLPASIPIDTFSTNPETCLPLKNLFLLAGIKDISKEVTSAKQGSATKFKNLLERISDRATKHFREIWNEYKSVSFSLTPNGVNIDAGIKERNTFTFQQRSDGFKRFMSFLLILSANERNKELNDCLILVDEPDISLHPSGIRYLRDELLKISKKNIVVTSTHSIFMIDDNCIERHLMIKKDDERTIVEIPNENNIADEEVLYRALGFSIYELLNNDNILFEGWKDKKLYKTALERVPAEYKEIKERYKNVGVSHSFGVKGIRNTVQIFELTNRHLYIISDNDKPAIEKQKEFKKLKFYGEWYKYSDVEERFKQVTGEDFLKMDYVKKNITELKKSNKSLTNDPNYEDVAKGILFNIGNWIQDNNVTGDEKETLINNFKDSLFDNLKPSDIAEDYYEFLLTFSNLINPKGN